MKLDFLRKVIPLTLSAGMFLSVPAVLPQVADLPVVSVSQAEAAAKSVNWEFKKDLDGWKYGGKWVYKGKPEVKQSAKFGGSIEVNVDYSPVADATWSEVKLEYGKATEKPLDITGANVVSYDFYYRPANMTKGGQFKTKIYAKDTKDAEVINVAPDIDLEKAKDAGDGWKVVPVKIQVPQTKNPLTYFMVSIVGSQTDYKGPLYIGKLSAHYEKLPDGYVNVKQRVKAQQPVDAAKLSIAATAPVVDKDATPKTAATYAFLKAIAATPDVIYGHQNEMNRKVAKNLPGLSDTYDMVRDFSGIVGCDALALTGNELELTDAERAAGETYSAKLARLVLPAAKQGAIVTMSMHMPNFAAVAKRPLVDGKYDYTGYSPNDTSGNVVQRIMPGGDLNKVYTGYLDMVADFLGRMQDADVPVLFRPFHENTGSWFWWGAAYCTPSEFKNLYRYTVEYMRDTRHLHNLLYVYSPGGPVKDAAEYALRYPGDAFIDICGFDMYHRDPAVGDTWFDGFKDTMTAVDSFTKEHDKVGAVTEVGILVGNTGGALAKTGNKRPDWFNEALQAISPHDMAYFMTWSNFNEGNFDQPYMVTAKRGHEMVNQFIDFYNAPQSVFAKEIPALGKLSVKAVPAEAEYGYISAPSSMERVLAPLQVRAKAAGTFKDARFTLTKKDGTVAATFPAVKKGEGVYAGWLSDEALASVGRTVGAVNLILDGKTADSVQVLFNMPAPAPDPALVDDFESYYGDGSLLKGAYSTNCGAGCAAEPLLSEHRENGEAGLDFHYTINKGGYAGIIKSLKSVNWSGYNAIQFWITPDGKGQKLIIQTNSNGGDFEVDLTELAKKTEPQLVTLPFSQFKGKNGGVFDKSAVQHFAIYCNTIGDAPVDSHIYFDDIQAVK